MPLYNYTCRQCGWKDEELSEGYPKDCPVCGGLYEKSPQVHTFASPGQSADLEALNHAAFGRNKSLGSTAKVEQELERRGLGVMTPDEAAQAQEVESDRYATLKRIARQDGPDAALNQEERWETESTILPAIESALKDLEVAQ